MPISPISPRSRFFDIVAILSSFIVDVSLSPVCLNSGCLSVIVMSVVFGFCVLEDMNTATTSFSPSWRTSAGLSLVAVRSVNGKGMSTIFPFSCI